MPEYSHDSRSPFAVGVRVHVSVVAMPLNALGVAVIAAVVAVNSILLRAPLVRPVGSVSPMSDAVSQSAKDGVQNALGGGD